jgi:hypothetical protein
MVGTKVLGNSSPRQILLEDHQVARQPAVVMVKGVCKKIEPFESLPTGEDRLLFQARRRACSFSLPLYSVLVGSARSAFAERRDVLLVLQNRLVLAFVTTGNWCRGSVTYTIFQNLLCMDGFLRVTI